MKREDWLKLTPEQKVQHRLQRVIDSLDKLQSRYDRQRSSGKIAEPISFLERTP